MKRKDEDDAPVGADISPTIIKTSVLPNDDCRVRVHELTPEKNQKVIQEAWTKTVLKNGLQKTSRR